VWDWLVIGQLGSLCIRHALRTLSLPDEVTGRVKTEGQASGLSVVNDVEVDVFARDRLITYATDALRSMAVNPTNERDGEATVVDATLHVQAQFILEQHCLGGHIPFERHIGLHKLPGVHQGIIVLCGR